MTHVFHHVWGESSRKIESLFKYSTDFKYTKNIIKIVFYFNLLALLGNPNESKCKNCTW